MARLAYGAFALLRKIALGEGIAGTAVVEKRGVVVPDVSQAKNYSEADQFGGVEMRAIVIAPIQSQGQVIGIIEAINPMRKGVNTMSNTWAAIITLVLIIAALAAASPSEARRGADDRVALGGHNIVRLIIGVLDLEAAGRLLAGLRCRRQIGRCACRVGRCRIG